MQLCASLSVLCKDTFMSLESLSKNVSTVKAREISASFSTQRRAKIGTM